MTKVIEIKVEVSLCLSEFRLLKNLSWHWSLKQESSCAKFPTQGLGPLSMLWCCVWLPFIFIGFGLKWKIPPCYVILRIPLWPQPALDQGKCDFKNSHVTMLNRGGFLLTPGKVALLSDLLFLLPAENRDLENEQCSKGRGRKPRFSVTKHW